MRFAFYCTEGYSLCLWNRLLEEGFEVLVYIEAQDYKEVGDGIVEKAGTFDELKKWAGDDAVWVFDGNGAADKADALRAQGRLVINDGSFSKRLESDRMWGEELAKTYGISAPETKRFKTLDEAMGFLEKVDGEDYWYFKSDKYLEGSATFGTEAEHLVPYLTHLKSRFGNSRPCILQKQLEGVAISTNAWFNGSIFVPPFGGTIEHKKFLEGDKGPHTGCQINLGWHYEDVPTIAKELHFEEMASFFRKMKAGPGVYDINALISSEDEKPYFLEWTPRFGYDSEASAFNRIKGTLGEFLYALASGTLAEAPFDTGTLDVSTRLSIPPYPWEHIDKNPVERKKHTGTPVGGTDTLSGPPFAAYGLARDEEGLYVADPYGLVGIACAVGTNLGALCEEINETAEKIAVGTPNLQWRADALETLQGDLDMLQELGYLTHEALD